MTTADAEAPQQARLPEGKIITQAAFLEQFESGEPVTYYKGPSLSADIERDAAFKSFRDWLWDYVISKGRGTFVQRRVTRWPIEGVLRRTSNFEYLAVPFKRSHVDG